MDSSSNLPVALLERMETSSEQAPEHLLSLLKDQIQIVWLDEFISEPTKFDGVKIIAIMVFHGKPKVTSELVDKLSHLKLVAVFGAGYNNIDTKMLQSKGIKVSNTPHVLDDTCANQAMMLLLACGRDFIEDVRRTMAPQTKSLLKNSVSPGIDGKTLGIVGMGNIGFAVAKRAKVFNMVIRYHNRQKRADDGVVGAHYHQNLLDMLHRCDYVMVCCALTPQTRHIIGEKELQHMRGTAALINVSRGGTVDHRALAEALRKRTIRFAALDVTEPEPLPRDHELLELDNVIITGHTSSATWACRRAMCQMTIDNVVACWKGQDLPSEVPDY